MKRITWDEPDGCTTPRGWAHCDMDQGEYTCVGNYLDYTPFRDRPYVHAVAYVLETDKLTGRMHTRPLGVASFKDVKSAKLFIEQRIDDHRSI